MDNISLKEHQKTAINYSREQDVYALLMDMGTGKTLCDIVDTIQSNAYPWLIVTRNGVKINWQQEIIKWTGHTDIQILKGTRAQKARALKSDARYFITNYESLYSLHSDIIKRQWGKVSFDESSSIKNASAKCTHYAWVIRQSARRARLLTGTPIGRNPLDLFSQFYILDPRILGFYARPKSKKPISSAFFGFRHKYAEIEYQYHYGRKHEAIKKDDNGKPVFKNIDEIRRLIEPYSYMVKKEDCLDLPEQIIMTREITMHEDQRRIYDELVADSVADIPEHEVMSVPNALAKMCRLQQVLGGNVVLDDGKGKRRVPENKTEAVFDILEEIGDNRAVIWCRFTDEIAYLNEQLTRAGYNVITYYGDTEDKDAVYAKVTAGDYDVLIANAQSGGIGLNFTTASYAIYYSRSWNLIEYLQSRDRIYRMGQTNKVTQIILTTADTLEVALHKSLEGKKEFSDFFTAPSKDGFVNILKGNV